MSQEQRIRVLLFEDYPQVRRFVADVLERCGCEVIAFPSPKACLFQGGGTCHLEPGESCGDVIISGLDMPDSRGIDFAEIQIKKECRIKHIALMSGCWTPEDEARAEKLGIKLFQKPFLPSVIKEWIDEIKPEIDFDRVLVPACKGYPAFKK